MLTLTFPIPIGLMPSSQPLILLTDFPLQPSTMCLLTSNHTTKNLNITNLRSMDVNVILSCALLVYTSLNIAQNPAFFLAIALLDTSA